MKKMIALLLAAMMVLSMAACASKTAENAAPADTAEPAATGPAAAADAPLTAGHVHRDLDDGAHELREILLGDVDFHRSLRRFLMCDKFVS